MLLNWISAQQGSNTKSCLGYSGLFLVLLAVQNPALQWGWAGWLSPLHSPGCAGAA